MSDITTVEQLISEIDEFIREISYHTGYRSIVHIMENPFIQMLSKITGYNPGYFGFPVNNGEYVKFDVEKVKAVRDTLKAHAQEINQKMV